MRNASRDTLGDCQQLCVVHKILLLLTLICPLFRDIDLCSDEVYVYSMNCCSSHIVGTPFMRGDWTDEVQRSMEGLNVPRFLKHLGDENDI